MTIQEIKKLLWQATREKFLMSGKTYEEIAREMGVTRQWVWQVIGPHFKENILLETLDEFASHFGIKCNYKIEMEG